MAKELDIDQVKRQYREALSKKLYRFTDNIREQSADFTVLFLRKKNIKHTPEDLANILEVFKMAVEDTYMKTIDNLLADVDKDMDRVLEEVNPLDTITTTKKESSGSNKPLTKETVKKAKTASSKR